MVTLAVWRTGIQDVCDFANEFSVELVCVTPDKPTGLWAFYKMSYTTRERIIAIPRLTWRG